MTIHLVLEAQTTTSEQDMWFVIEVDLGFLDLIGRARKTLNFCCGTLPEVREVSVHANIDVYDGLDEKMGIRSLGKWPVDGVGIVSDLSIDKERHVYSTSENVSVGHHHVGFHAETGDGFYPIEAIVDMEYWQRIADMLRNAVVKSWPEIPVGTRVRTLHGEGEPERCAGCDIPAGAVGEVAGCYTREDAMPSERRFYDIAFPSGARIALFEYEIRDPRQYEILPDAEVTPA